MSTPELASSSIGNVLAVLWPNAVAKAPANELASLADLRIVRDPSDDERSLFVPESFTDEQEKYFVATRVAAKLADAAIANCNDDHTQCPDATTEACRLLREKFPDGDVAGDGRTRRNAVLGAHLAIPEAALKALPASFQSDIGMVAASFQVPLIAAYLRLKDPEAGPEASPLES